MLPLKSEELAVLVGDLVVYYYGYVDVACGSSFLINRVKVRPRLQSCTNLNRFFFYRCRLLDFGLEEELESSVAVVV